MPFKYVPFYSLAGVTSTGAGVPADMGMSLTDPFMQIVISGAATVKVEASDDLANWTNVSDPSTGYTSSTIVKLDARVPFYRANVTSYTSGEVTAVISAGKGRHKELLNVGSAAGGLVGGGGGGPNLLNILLDYVQKIRRINTTAPLAGGGDLSADRTLSIAITAANDGGAVAKQAATPGTVQIGHFNVSGTGIAGRIVVDAVSTTNAIQGTALPNGVGVEGIATDAAAVQGTATTGKGVKGNATGLAGIGVDAQGTGLQAIGVRGQSSNAASGFFQSAQEVNAIPTVILRRITAGATANLLEAQAQDGSPIAGIDSTGHLFLGGVGVTITTGNGAPASTPGDGSIYLRKDGAAATTLYVRAAGAWTALS